MAKFITTARGWFLKEVESYLSSLGIALLVVSMFLVPTSGLRADEGDPGEEEPAAVACNDVNCNANPPTCKQKSGQTACEGTGSHGYDACAAGGCTRCGCRLCEWTTGGVCGCICSNSTTNGCPGCNGP
jgi:hypothetical protein